MIAHAREMVVLMQKTQQCVERKSPSHFAPVTSPHIHADETDGGQCTASHSQGDGKLNAMDTTGDGMMNAFDSNGDGQFNAWDTTGDGNVDAIDSSGDGRLDSFDTTVRTRCMCLSAMRLLSPPHTRPHTRECTHVRAHTHGLPTVLKERCAINNLMTGRRQLRCERQVR